MAASRTRDAPAGHRRTVGRAMGHEDGRSRRSELERAAADRPQLRRRTRRGGMARRPIAHAASSPPAAGASGRGNARSEEHTSELQSLMRITYAILCLKKKKKI